MNYMYAEDWYLYSLPIMHHLGCYHVWTLEEYYARLNLAYGAELW